MKDYAKYYSQLNELQKLAVDTIDGPVLVLAGPGTGKTQLLSVRAGSILKKKRVGPDNILILTYTNSASKAMKERLAKIVGPEGYDVGVGTFHSFANSIIQESEEAANHVGDKIQMDVVEQVKAIEYILDHAKGVEEIHPFRAPYIYLNEILKRIGELKRDGISPEEFDDYLSTKKDGDMYLEEKHMKRLGALSIVYRMYEELKEGKDENLFDERGRYDFDDMILFATEALKKEAVLKEKYQRVFQYVMVDEYQDTNGAQLELLFTLLGYKMPNLCCVGDDDQSIYRFQGASVGNFKILKERFPDIKILSLKDNYRSTKELIEASSRIINLIPLGERAGEKILVPSKDYREKEIEFREFTTVGEELLYVVDKIRELKDRIEGSGTLTDEERSHPYNNIAVLVRKRSDILKIIEAFLQAGIPYATDGKEDISGERRVKQLLDVLELAYIDPKELESKDLALYKVLTSDYLRMSQVDILRLIGYVNRKKRGKEGSALLTEFLQCLALKGPPIKFEDENSMRDAARAIKRLLEDARTRPVHAILMDFINDAGLFKYILKEYREKKVLKIRELRSISSFVNMVKGSDLAKPGIRLDDFMQEVKTRKDHGLPIQGELVTMTQDGVRIYTAHGSKGQEFHSVIIPFCLQNKNWPARALPEKIPLPLDLFKTKEKVLKDKTSLKQLFLYDETRLFYVAMTRSKSNLIFTSSPTEDAVSSFYLGGLDIHGESPEYVNEEEVLEKSLESTDLEDPFIGTAEVLEDMIKDLSLNPTSLNNYITCRRKFLYDDVLMLPGPKRQSLVFGNCVHKALEEVYENYQKKKRFPPFKFFYDAFAKELKFQGVDKAIEARCMEKAKTLKNWFELASKNPVIPIGLEKKIAVTVGDGVRFTGKYDKVEWEDAGKNLVRIIDYKTGKPDRHLKALDDPGDLASDNCDEYLRQLVSYKLLFEKDRRESGGRKVRCGVLVFIEPVSVDLRRLGYRKGDYASKAIEISNEMVQEMGCVIKDVWKDIKALRFEKLPERDKDKCENCDFDGLCWEKEYAK